MSTTNCSGALHIVGCGRFLIIKILSYVCAIVSVALNLCGIQPILVYHNILYCAYSLLYIY